MGDYVHFKRGSNTLFLLQMKCKSHRQHNTLLLNSVHSGVELPYSLRWSGLTTNLWWLKLVSSADFQTLVPLIHYVFKVRVLNF